MSTNPFIRLMAWHAATRAPLSNTIYRFARRYIMGWSNVEQNADRNGERWVVETVLKSATEPHPVVFDVGANVGDWSALVAPHLPRVRLLAFEPVPPVRDVLRRSLEGTSAEIFDYALSNENGSVQINYTPGNPHLSSLESMGGAMPLEVQTIEVARRTGGDLCAELGIDHIRFLKVDTEGHDLKVLQGFARMIAESRIDVIQFEYNYMSIYSRTFLKDFFDALTPGMRIGRLLPGRVEFFDYMPALDNFIQSNFIAVRRDLHGPGLPFFGR